MSLMDFLSPALTVGAGAAGTGMEAQHAVQQQEQSKLMQLMAQMRAQHEADSKMALEGAQTDAASGTAAWRRHQAAAPPPIQHIPEGAGVPDGKGGFTVPVPKTVPPELKVDRTGKQTPTSRTTGLDPDGNPVFSRQPPDPGAAMDKWATQQREVQRQKYINDTTREYQAGKKDQFNIKWIQPPMAPLDAQKRANDEATQLFGPGSVGARTGVPAPPPGAGPDIQAATKQTMDAIDHGQKTVQQVLAHPRVPPAVKALIRAKYGGAPTGVPPQLRVPAPESRPQDDDAGD